MPTPADWEWSSSARRYRVLTKGTGTGGQFVTLSTTTRLRDVLAASRVDVVNALAELLARGDLSVQRWTLEMREQIRLTHQVEYVFGRGGLRAMVDSDDAILRGIV